MFDAFFVPPELARDDVARLREFGVDAVLIPITALRQPTSEWLAERAEHQLDAARTKLHAQLTQAGVLAWFADAISPELEPDAMWEDQWTALRAGIVEGRIAAIGELSLPRISSRSLRILDRHLALSEALDVPVLVLWDDVLWDDAQDERWRHELLARARQHHARWWWTRVPAKRVAELSREGVGVIATIGGRDHRPEALARVIASLPEARIALGSGRGRGLNPFALASVEIAAARLGATKMAAPRLEGGELAVWLRR